MQADFLVVLYRLFQLEKYSSFSKVQWNLITSINVKVIKNLTALLLPIFIILIVQMFQNYYLFDGFFSNPHWESLNPKEPFSGILASFFRIDRGLLIFSPVLLFSFFGIKSFYKRYMIKSVFIYLIMLAPIMLYSSTLISWTGLDNYSFRYYVPIIPYFYIPMAFWYKEKDRKWFKLFFLLLAISIIINFQAAIFHTLIWNGPPWKIISLLIKNWHEIFF